MDKIEIEKRIEYINQRLIWLKKSLNKYKLFETDEEERYLALRASERECEEIVESATRINQELLKETGNIGDTYRESFEKLVLLGLLKDNKKIVEKLANTTGFRNRLAHDYIDLDEKITIKSAQNILEIYPKYLIEIINYISK